MKKINKKYIIYLMVYVFVLCICGCSKSKSPKVISDLFAGEERLWFMIADDELTYDEEVTGIIKTYKNQVIEGYYYIRANGLECDIEPNPCTSDQYELFTIADFDNMSDDEIIEKVKEKYGSFAITYPFPSFTIGSMKVDNTLEAENLPYKIVYDGDLDASGNGLLYEKVSLCSRKILTNFINYQSTYFDTEFYIEDEDDFLQPTIIKNKEYVGIVNKNKMLITRNTYKEFGQIGFDTPEIINAE